MPLVVVLAYHVLFPGHEGRIFCYLDLLCRLEEHVLT
jgi:hypothetical protein